MIVRDAEIRSRARMAAFYFGFRLNQKAGKGNLRFLQMNAPLAVWPVLTPAMKDFLSSER